MKRDRLTVWKLVKEATTEQWMDARNWLWYTAVGVIMPLLFAWFGYLNSGKIVGVWQLIGHGELYLYSATFWIYTLYSLDKTQLGAGFTRLLPYSAVTVIGFGFALMQKPQGTLPFHSEIVKISMVVSIVLLILSILLCFVGNLVAQSRVFLEEKARLADAKKLQEDNEIGLEQAFNDLGGLQ